ncbi:MAG: NAD-dependent epimerase/dehydratase family protein [Polyangiales bacterium]
MSAPRCPFAHRPDQRPASGVTVVTGASGHIGINLVRALRDAGRPVRAVIPGPTRALDGLDVEVAYADVRHPETLRAAFRGADAVFHLAARISIDADRDGQVHAVNVWGARNAAEAALAAGVRRFVHMSSVHAYDLTHPGTLDEHGPRAGAHNAAYDRSKALGEVEVQKVVARGLDAVILNPVGVLGPGDPGTSHTGRGLRDIALGRVPVVPAGGFHFVDVRDVVHSALAAAERGRTGANYLLTGTWASSLEFAHEVLSVVGGRPPRVLPAPMFLAAARVLTAGARTLGVPSVLTPEMVHTLQATRQISGARAVEELGHHPRPLRESIRDSLAWYRANALLGDAVAA